MYRAAIEGLASLLGVVAFGVLFQVPRSRLLPAGLCGMAAWSVYSVLLTRGISRFASAFISAAVLASLAEWAARRLRVPVTVLVVPGIIPLVPGADAYSAMLAFVQGRDQQGLQLAVQTALTGLSIAAGAVGAATAWRPPRVGVPASSGTRRRYCKQKNK